VKFRLLLKTALVFTMLLVMFGCNATKKFENGDSDSNSNTEPSIAFEIEPEEDDLMENEAKEIIMIHPNITFTSERIETRIKNLFSVLVAGINNNDGELARKVLHDNMVVHGGPADWSMTVDEWCEAVSQGLGYEDHIKEVVFFDITSTAAIAKTEFTHPVTEDVDTCFYTLVQYNGFINTSMVWNLGGKAMDREQDETEQEKKEVEKTIRMFFDGFENIDAELIIDAFYNDEAEMFNYNYNNGGIAISPVSSWRESCDSVKNQPDYMLSREISENHIVFIDVAGDAAVAKTKYIFTKYTYTDYYNLIKAKNRWYITNKTFSTEYK